MIKEATPIRIGSLIKTPLGVFGVVAKYDKKDDIYKIAWASGMRKGDTVIYEKKVIDYLLKSEEGWKLFPPSEDMC